MKNKKIYYGIILFLGVYFIIFFFLLNKKTTGKDLKNYAGLASGNDAFFLYENGNWVSINTRLRTNYNWYKFDVYSDNNFTGNYYMIYSGIWNLFDEKKKKIDESFDEMFGVTTDLKYKVLEFQNIDNSSIDDYIKKVLDKYNINSNVDFTVNNVITVDIDNDLQLEKIYTVTNTFSDIVQEVTFGFIFLVDEDKIYMIYDKIFESNSLAEACKPYVSNLLNIENRNYILVTCSYYSDRGRNVLLYRYKDKKIKEIISN